MKQNILAKSSIAKAPTQKEEEVGKVEEAAAARTGDMSKGQ